MDEEEFEKRNEANGEMSHIILSSGLVLAEELNKCLRLVEKDKIRGHVAPRLLDVVYERGLVDEKQKKVLNTAAERVERERTTSLFKIKGYKLIRKIGSGGLGVVYMAKQLSMKRKTAVKILHENWSKDVEFRNRFILEARVMGRLSHQNLIQVYDVGLEQNHYYFTMEYIDGLTVEQLIQENGALSVQDTVKIATHVTRAIKYISSFDIVHRDIKPANMMMTKSGVTKLGDFGFIFLRNEETLTQDGYVIGTPDYISPEQARGKEVDFRSDIYSLGVSMYHMLTGDIPYHGSVSTVMRQHVKASVPMRTTGSGVVIPTEIYNILCKMMAKNPDDRYDDLNELLGDLEYLNAQEVMKKREGGDPSIEEGDEVEKDSEDLEFEEPDHEELSFHVESLEKQNKMLFIFLSSLMGLCFLLILTLVFKS